MAKKLLIKHVSDTLLMINYCDGSYEITPEFKGANTSVYMLQNQELIESISVNGKLLLSPLHNTSEAGLEIKDNNVTIVQLFKGVFPFIVPDITMLEINDGAITAKTGIRFLKFNIIDQFPFIEYSQNPGQRSQLQHAPGTSIAEISDSILNVYENSLISSVLLKESIDIHYINKTYINLFAKKGPPILGVVAMEIQEDL